MTNKKTIMSRILDAERLEKTAQTEGEIDRATADKAAQEIFHRIFDEELKKIIQSGG